MLISDPPYIANWLGKATAAKHSEISFAEGSMLRLFESRAFLQSYSMALSHRAARVSTIPHTVFLGRIPY